jgi:hypothetical protein
MAFSNPVVGGEGGELIRASIKSPNFITLVQGWIIRRDGSAEFNNIVIRGGVVVGGDITIGPTGEPQVHIFTNANAGIIEFPVNESYETLPAAIQGELPAIANGPMSLIVRGPNASASEDDYAFIRMYSQSQSGLVQQKMLLSLGDTATLTQIEMTSGGININANDVDLDCEIRVANNGQGDTNFPARVAKGKVFTGVTNTTIGTVNDTLITDAVSSSTYLESGVAYRVDVQIPTRSTSGTSAAGTQNVRWKIWDGAVGGTQLGNTCTKMTESVGSNMSAQHVSFVFQHTGSSGSRNINLSALQITGTDTLQAQVNTQFFMLVYRIGDPANIINL